VQIQAWGHNGLYRLVMRDLNPRIHHMSGRRLGAPQAVAAEPEAAQVARLSLHGLDQRP